MQEDTSNNSTDDNVDMSKGAMKPVSAAWDEGYRQGVEDERTSEANIGYAGFGAKVEPARQNPYGTTPPKPPVTQRTWVGLTDEEIEREWQHQMAIYIEEVDSEYWGVCDSEFARAIEAKLKEKNI